MAHCHGRTCRLWMGEFLAVSRRLWDAVSHCERPQQKKEFPCRYRVHGRQVPVPHQQLPWPLQGPRGHPTRFARFAISVGQVHPHPSPACSCGIYRSLVSGPMAAPIAAHLQMATALQRKSICYFVRKFRRAVHQRRGGPVAIIPSQEAPAVDYQANWHLRGLPMPRRSS